MMIYFLCMCVVILTQFRVNQYNGDVIMQVGSYIHSIN